MLHAYVDIVLWFLVALLAVGLVVILIAHWLDARATARRPADHRASSRTPQTPPAGDGITFAPEHRTVDDVLTDIEVSVARAPRWWQR